MAVTAALKLASLTRDVRYVDITHQTLAQYPLGLGQ